MLRIACVGDSLTRGDGSHEGRSQHPLRGNYPAHLQSRLSNAIVRNFGHGGATACNASDVPFELTREFRKAKAFRPHIVVLMLGTNDAKRQHWHAICDPGADSLTSGIRRISMALQTDKQAMVLLVPPPPVLKEKWGIRRSLLPLVVQAVHTFHKERRLNDTGVIQCAPGAMHLAPPLPFWNDDVQARRASFVSDGVHLSRRGSQRLANHVWQALSDLGCLDLHASTGRSAFLRKRVR